METNPEISLGVGVLAWKAPETLERTLKGLTEKIPVSFFKDAVVFCQEISDRDRTIAEKYGFRAEGNGRNLGIREGIKQTVSAVRAEVVLFLECDCLLVQEPEAACRILTAAANEVSSRRLDVVRLRHLQQLGSDYITHRKYLRYWPGDDEPDTAIRRLRRFLRPAKARRLIGQACIVCAEPEKKFSGKIGRESGGRFLCMNSLFVNWTNQSILFRKEWFLNTLIPYAEAHPSSRTVNGFQDLEKELNCRWWRRQHFNVGWASPGLFTHHRTDRPDEDEKTYLHRPMHG